MKKQAPRKHTTRNTYPEDGGEAEAGPSMGAGYQRGKTEDGLGRLGWRRGVPEEVGGGAPTRHRSLRVMDILRVIREIP